MAGDVVRRRSLRLAVTTAADWVAVRLGRPERDPCNQFDWMMEQSERRGLRSAFYFICGGTAGTVDGDYRMEYPLIRALVHRIATRGHEIGLHGSYNSYRDEKQLLREFARLRQVCAEESVRQQEWGGRQHFLRWRIPESIRHWDQAGLAYDSTLAFAELAGFRCGTCHEFPGFDLATQEPLRVRERPLVVMECSVIDACYMGLGETAAAYDAIASLKRTCRRFDGNFTLLWHNSRLSTPRQRELYVSVLDA
jgi:hypothetical protein